MRHTFVGQLLYGVHRGHSLKMDLRGIKRLFSILAAALFTGTVVQAQVVTPWMTKGDQSVLLQAQAPISSFTPYSGGGTAVLVDTSAQFQSIDGFGFCLTQGSAEVINGLNGPTKANLLNELFTPSGLNITMLRISIGASDLSNSTYSYNEAPGDVNMTQFSLAGPDSIHLIPLLQEILAINPSIKILATPWTAPTWMKTNGSWKGGRLSSSYYPAYSQYFVKYLQAMDAYGISIWGITPQNEPENPWNEPSMLMNTGEQTNFINNHLGPAIAASGYAPKIIAFDHNCDNTSYPISVLNNSAYVDGAAFHMYAGNISALSTVKNATGKNVYFTEQYTDVNGDFNGDLGWHMENVIAGSLNNWSKCVLEWNLATDATHGPHTPGGCQDCLGALTINDSTDYDINVSYYIIGHVSKFVQPGAVRIGVTTNSSKLLVTGFKNPNGTLTVLAYNYYDGANDAENIQLVLGTGKIDFSIPPRTAVTFAIDPSGPIGLAPIPSIKERQLLRTINLLGQEVDFAPNIPLIQIFSDGSQERIIQLDE